MEENMSEEHETRIVSTPRHLWVIGVVALLWNAMGAMDYVMTQTRNEAYLSSFTPEQLAFFHGFPTWVVAAWAIAVWGGVLGTILLLLRRRHAVWTFLASLIAMVLTAFHNYVLSNGMEVVGDAFSLGFTAAIFIIALALFLYARAMQKQNILV
jgi:hypothetical protein